MLTFHVYRAKVMSSAQRHLFARALSPGEILRSALLETPSIEVRRGYVWHIGNVHKLDDHSFYFAMGRVTTKTVELWMEDEQAFTDVEYEGAPYTHGLIDTELEVCAIARKVELDPSVDGIASKLERLLNRSSAETLQDHRIEIAPIFDPADFLQALRGAYAIRSFTATFGLPNPWDVERDFQKPLQDFTRKARGEKTKATVSGVGLDVGTLEDVTRSAAASGNDVHARIQQARGAKTVPRKLKGNPLTFPIESVDSIEERKKAMSDARDYYQYVRDSLKDNE